MKNFILFILLVFSVKFCFAEFDMNQNMRQAYVHIMHLDFSLAQKILDTEKISNNDNGIIILNENYIDFLTILIGEDELYYKKAKLKKNQRLSSLRKNDKDSPYYLYCQAEVYIQWAFTRIKFKEYFLAAYELQKAYKLLEKNNQLYPDFVLNKKSLGLLHILIGSIPKSHNFILNILAIEGGIDKGFNELYSVLDYSENLEEYYIYNSEVLFLLSFLEMNMKNDSKSCSLLLGKIENCCLNNNLLIFCAARLSNKLGDNDKTIQILENRIISDTKYNFYYLDYLYAMSQLYKLEYHNANDYLLRFVNSFKGKNYIKSAYHMLSLIALLEDNMEKKKYYEEMMLNNGQVLIDEDKQAEDYVKNETLINITLLKSRFLFDGGYYKETLDYLSNINLNDIENNQEFILEYYYRISRSNQGLSVSPIKVIDLFSKVLMIDNPSNLYYHPMSSLQIGLEYEKLRDNDQAIKFFKQTLSYKDFNYENGIKKSAKAGINRALY
tara:strand:- start:1157 stop:2647 length:1491 start_codon:yes stop_codon:yes gene_type:complete